jgi:hypothetical protein
MRPQDGQIGPEISDKEPMRMRRIALLGLILTLPLALSGCDYAGNPFDGFGGFIADTHTPFRDPHQPAGDAANMQRVEGLEVSAEPLQPEAGNAWPGKFPVEPTLEELERSQNSAMPPATAPVGNKYPGMTKP